MTAQTHLFRLLTLLRLLNDRPGRTVTQAAQTLDTSPRTVYRYLDTLRELGYCIDTDLHDRYFLFEADPVHRPAFTPQESAMVVRLLAGQAADNPLTESIRRKLYLTSSLLSEKISVYILELSGKHLTFGPRFTPPFPPYIILKICVKT